MWTGFNADDHYGNTRECAFEQHRMKKEGANGSERKEAFDRWRAKAYRKTASQASTWWHAQQVAGIHGKQLLDPYLDYKIRAFFHKFDHSHLSSPRKPLIRQALRQHLKGLPDSTIAPGVRLQISGGIDTLFASLLNDGTINRFDVHYKRVSALCQRWAREVRDDPERVRSFLAGIKGEATGGNVAKRETYRPYTMADVRAASAKRKFGQLSPVMASQCLQPK